MNTTLVARHRRPGTLLLFLIAAVLLAAPVLAQDDDLNLLTRNRAEPFVFILLDTSASMATEIGTDAYVEGGADDPRSKLYAAKEALYTVFDQTDDFRFGFATYDQGELHVISKHWLYYVPRLDSLGVDMQTELDKLVVGWPRSVSTGVPVDEGVTPDGDLLTFGATFPAATASFLSANGQLCNAAINIATVDGRRQANHYAHLGADGSATTQLWVKNGNGGTAHRLTFSRVDAVPLGDPSPFRIRIVAESTPCADPNSPVLTAVADVQVEVERERAFLLSDFPVGDSDTTDFASFQKGNGGNVKEAVAGYWDYRDVEGSWLCGDTKPFSGSGWEGNYDTTAAQVLDTGAPDQFCSNPADATTCTNLKQTTVTNTILAPHKRELDVGDVLPFSWSSDTREAFLTRLNPLRPDGGKDFGQANYFKDAPGANGAFPLVDPDNRPLIAAGPSPAGTAMLDFRCWYAGFDSNKCKNINAYTDGFMRLQKLNDLEFKCRRPYLIIIGDGEENCGDANNWNSAISNFTNSQAENVDGDPIYGQVWAFQMGQFKYPTIGPSDGEVIEVTDKAKLVAELQRIKGEIEEQTRSFASAAVPSVQADVADKIYLTSFEPIEGLTYWRGHADAFLKPLPIKIDVTGNALPDPTPCPSTDPRSSCRLWDAAEKLLGQVSGVLDYTDYPNTSPTIPLPTTAGDLSIGTTKTTRRVYYPTAQKNTGDAVPRERRLLAPPAGPASDNDYREDLWNGLRISTVFQPLGTIDPSTFDTYPDIRDARDEAETILVKTLFAKRAIIGEGAAATTQTFILGDVFHANPLVIGAPSNQRYLSDPDEFPDYRTFFDKHARRRKVLLLAVNDGQLHAFDAGRFAGNADTGGFVDDADGGTELFSFVPRSVMPALTKMAALAAKHVWSVDGNPIAFDAFVDVAHNGTPVPANREWRTVVLGGLRQGGKAVYAFDMTQPDSLVEDFSGSTFLGVRPSHTNVLPDCASANGSGSVSGQGFELGCDDRVHYPELLWEFIDDEWSYDNSGMLTVFAADGVPDDTDGLCGPDLGETWSTPNLGVIKIAKPDGSGGKELDALGNVVYEQRYVAVFGGGRDPDGKLQDPNVAGSCASGSFLYIVDVETGKILLKSAVVGSVPAESAAVDTNQDGYLDRVYFGTTAGYLYRMDIDVPPLVDAIGKIIPEGQSWQPFPILDTTTTEPDELGVNTVVRRQIFFRPSVFFLPDQNEYAVAVATGARDKMWAAGPVGGNRVFAFTDDIEPDPLTPGVFPVARTQADYVDVVTLEASQTLDGLDFLNEDFDGAGPLKRGWFIKLVGLPVPVGEPRPNEVAITPVTAISGLTALSTYVPRVVAVAPQNNVAPTCQDLGTSFNYLVFTDNAEGILPDSADADSFGDRSEEVGDVFVSEPFVEQGQTKNEVAAVTDPCAGKEAIAEELKSRIFPSNCRFSYFRFDLKTMRSDTGINCITSIPVCIVEKNWKEF